MTIITETPRLLIRRFTLDDAAAVYHFNSPEEVNRYTGDAGMCTTVDQARGIITDIWLKEYQQYGYARWAVVLKETGQIIGFCGFKYEPHLNGTDIGYRLHPDFWGKGYATEANQACLEYARRNMDFKEVFGEVVAENHASARVLTKLGLTYQLQYQEDGFTIHRYGLSLKD
ncbi:GNAT family N-acetyltransferase [Ferrimonas marina]|uniref:Protein N-acetyltransferase, RimJ/RimL family n=1 Tax=Ferrimonas marina TaxID=299255 RepID=A0A1M5RZB7_9GAMM|nr:GNAT family N-acetyltransferase [Ferrimonas marina]SHH31540.1 Protein N-acetyltransferase, RimJ/RimL family [Ferrimonas marina]